MYCASPDQTQTLWTNGIVEHFNERISKVITTTYFNASKDLDENMYQYPIIYNHHIPLKNLGYTAPIQTIKDCQKKWPGLFNEGSL